MNTQKGLRVTLPYRQLLSQPTWHNQGVIQVIVGAGMLFTIPVGLYLSIPPSYRWMTIVVVVIVFSVALALIWLESRYLKSGKTRSTVEVGGGVIRLRELSPTSTQFFATTFNAIEICRLRILQLPLVSLSDEYAMAPSIWIDLNQREHSLFGLVAESAWGRQMYPIAIGYPEKVMIDLAKQVKRQLDEERRIVIEHLQEITSGPQHPDLTRGVPVCVGLPKKAIRENPVRPARTKVELVSENAKLLVRIPRGDNLEETEMEATKEYLQIRRQLLLGETNLRIPAGRLIDIRAEDSDPLSQDDGLTFTSLRVDYVDVYGRKTYLPMLEELTLAELCWIEHELKKAGPELVDASTIKVQERFRFTIVQLAFYTALTACCMASFAFDFAWGWLYSITLIAAVLCVTSFTGYQPLGRFTRRSWSATQIKGLISIISLLWVPRLIAFFVE